MAGTLHIHTNRSDGGAGPDEIAAAAARAGLKFIVFTDHGDATRKPDPPAYRSGVLCLDGVEILFHASGSSGIRLSSPLTRAVADLRAINQHGLLNLEMNRELYGRVLLGVEQHTPLI